MRKTVFIASAAVMILTGCGGEKPPPSDNTFTDSRDGQVYKTVKIGSQVWMAENLKYGVSKDRNKIKFLYREIRYRRKIKVIRSVCYGEEGFVVVDEREKKITDEEIQANCTKYGLLYDWDMARKACPAGYHLPTNAEWYTLVEFVGGYETAGTKLKSKTGWDSSENASAGTDDYGFSALPGGVSRGYCQFFRAGYSGVWWSATEQYGMAAYAWTRGMDGNGVERVDTAIAEKADMFSVRCVKDG